MNLLKYIYIKLYNCQLKQGRDDPSYPIIGIVFPLIFNIWTIVGVIQVATNTKLPPASWETIAFILGLACFLFFLFYNYLAKDKSLNKIIKEFKNLSKKQRKRYNIASLLSVILYLTITVASAIHFMPMARELNITNK